MLAVPHKSILPLITSFFIQAKFHLPSAKQQTRASPNSLPCIETISQLSTATSTQVVSLCGRLPLALAIAGSMSAVKGKGLTAAAWEELARLFENKAGKKGRVKGEQSTSLHAVLGASLNALSERKQEEMLKTAVLAAGAVAPIEMLLNLWEIQVGCVATRL